MCSLASTGPEACAGHLVLQAHAEAMFMKDAFECEGGDSFQDVHGKKSMFS